MRENPQKTPKTRERPARNLRETQEKLTRKPRESHKTNPKRQDVRGVFCALGAEKSTICLSLHLPNWIRFGLLEQKMNIVSRETIKKQRFFT